MIARLALTVEQYVQLVFNGVVRQAERTGGDVGWYGGAVNLTTAVVGDVQRVAGAERQALDVADT